MLIFTLIPSVFAETIVTEHNFNTDNGDGTGTIRTHHPYVFDGNNWVPFVASGTQVQTHMGSVTLNGTGYFQWNGKFNDSIIAKYADISDLNTWTYPATLNNDVPDISWDGSQLVSEKNKVGVGNLKYKYVFDNGKWKTQLEATNLSALTTKVFGFDQTINLNSDTIKFGGITRNLDNFDGQTFDKEFLIANEGKVLDLLNGINFDFDLGFENLYSITVYDTGVNSSKLVFDYRTSEVLLPGETLIIDPTFNSGASTNDGRIFSTAVGGAACSATFGGIATTANINVRRDSGINDDCSASYFNFDISGAGVITSVSSATIEFDIVTSSNPLNCDFIHKATDFAGAQESWDALLSYTGATVVKNNDATCASGVADGYVVTFDSAIYPLIVADSTGDQTVSIGVGFDNWARDATTHRFDFRNNDAVLEFVYDTVPVPDSITDLTADSVGTTTASLSFTAPDLNGESLINYMLNVTTPQQDTPPSTFWMNGSSSPFAVTGLTLATDYSASASAYTAGGGNWTLANVLNFTTATVQTPAAVNDLDGVSNLSLSLITLSWTAPEPGGAPITGYMINYTTPVGSPQTKIENDTGSLTTSYNVLNLVIGTQYSFRVCAWNSFGCGIDGNIWNGTVETDYVIGNFSSPDIENTNDFSIFYDRTDVNATTISLEVLYPNTYDLECSMYYSFARINNTYGNLTSTVSGDDLVSVFQFVNATGDIITVTCADLITGDSAKYVITLTEFPFRTQLDNLRNGTYGTYFQIGAIDGITFMVVILGMIGLNRTTPIAGIMFVIIATLGLAYFEIITYPIIMYPALALLAVWGFMSTRKDD